MDGCVSTYLSSFIFQLWPFLFINSSPRRRAEQSTIRSKKVIIDWLGSSQDEVDCNLFEVGWILYRIALYTPPPSLSLSSSEACFRSDFDRPHCPLPFPPSGSTIRSPLEIPSSFLTISKPKVDDREAHSVPSTSRSVYKLHPTLPRRSNLSLSLFHQCHLMTRVWTWSILTDLTGWKSQELLMPWKPTCWAFLLRNSSHSQRLAQFLTKYSKDEFTSIPSVNLEEWRWVSWNH